MNSINEIQQYYRASQIFLKNKLPNYQAAYREDDASNRYVDIFRGITPKLWKDYSGFHCDHYLSIFGKYDIIPRYCFSCYKIVIKLKDIVQLFMLKALFDKIELPANNTRKCHVECRKGISGYYKGFIFSQDLQEAQDLLKKIKRLALKEISSETSVILKRGCSEFSQILPDYSTIDQNGKPLIKYPIEWKKTEELAWQNYKDAQNKPLLRDTHPSNLTVHEALTVLFWLKYAATIEDNSYLKITEKTLPKFYNLDMPRYQMGY